MKHLHTLPTSTGGGTPFGWHFISSFKECPTKWYNQYLRPHPAGTTGDDELPGVRPLYTGINLLIGSCTHDGLEAWYLSRVRDGEDTGEPNLDTAIAAVEECALKREDEFETDDIQADCLSQSKSLLLTYHNWFGSEGQLPEWPGVQVAIDDAGQPLVEQQFDLDMGYQGYYFTARLDLVCWSEGSLVSMEHKTSAAGWAGRRSRQFANDGQGMGQQLMLERHYGSGGLVANIIVKNRAKNSTLPPVLRESFTYSAVQMEKFHRDTVRTLARIDDAVGEYNYLCQSGMEPYLAADVAFDGTPTAGTCVGNFDCDFWSVCTGRGYEQGMLKTHFAARKAR